MDELSAKWFLYADDQVILTPSACVLQKMVNKMNDFVKERGMKVNFGKTKVMAFERGKSTNECDILIESEKVEQAKKFVYSGGMFTNNGKHDRYIQKRVNPGNKVNEALLVIMNSKSVSRQVRLAVRNGILILTLIYGSESRVWQKKNESRINAVKMRCDTK
ncbi:hypothetical protein EVAR_20735_1 [Eumeta japonica]|uniref:Reverse transcriptase domain-containing protein n=1 Tax=Eumeta variegata TaxID=151549 RepID=A0A4C1VAF5_EUMVA|nr:hypothetical protein EVAR_20735_1 [Eumeta japonica]